MRKVTLKAAKRCSTSPSTARGLSWSSSASVKSSPWEPPSKFAARNPPDLHLRSLSSKAVWQSNRFHGLTRCPVPNHCRGEAAESRREIAIHRRSERDPGFSFHRESHRMATRPTHIRRYVAGRGGGGIQSLRNSSAGDRRPRSRRCASAAYLGSATPTVSRSPWQAPIIYESSLAATRSFSPTPGRFEVKNNCRKIIPPE